MPSWLPIEEGTEVPNGSEFRPTGGGGFEFSPNDVGVEPCANPIARFVNGQLTWECRVLTCPTSCHSYEWVEDPTNPDTKRVRCQCAEL
ncbi:MAG: hypothetical protein KDB07_13355 [Planctomycetes bacterium]|nr:hypothetical protein [Planctomycetota bacterium]